MKYLSLPVWALCVLTGSLFFNTAVEAQSTALSGPSIVTAVRYCPRLTCANRMVGGLFQGSNDNSNWVTLATITASPLSNQWSTVTITNSATFRYLRYLSPKGGYGNIAELEFDGGPTNSKLIGTVIGTAGSFSNRGNDISKVFDGNFNSFFDAPTPNGDYVGLDLGAPAVVAPPVITPVAPPVVVPPVTPPVVVPPVIPPTTTPVIAPPVAPILPSAPIGLAASTLFTASCVVTNGKAMPHINLTSDTVPNATYYTIYRDGTPIQVGVTACTYTDMDLTSGQTYSYTVSATGTGGEGAQCAAVSATAPSPTAAMQLTAPTNLCVSGLWVGAAENILSWQSVPGAISYNVYLSDVRVASSITATSFIFTPDMLAWTGPTYTVTSVDSNGMESIPSAPAAYQFNYDPTAPAIGWAEAPVTPDTLSAIPEWNNGSPRNLIIWHGWESDSVYNVYRDGIKVASSLSNLYYIDSAVNPGETHSYTITGINTDWPLPVEGIPSAAISATALISPPAPLGSSVIITKVVPNDDSAEVFFTPIPGATDYGIYDVSNPAKVKYAGAITMQQGGGGFTPRMALSIEWNGIDPAVGANLVVEAVDKLGPFQRMDGDTGSGATNMSAMNGEAINGQGDPSNIPIVLAQSAPFQVTCTPTSLTGSQVFFDNFRNSQPLVKQPLPVVIPPNSQYYGVPDEYAAFDNDKWEIRQYGCDLTNSKLFFMGNHFMDTTYDGGTPGSADPPHNNVASMVMVPKATADISGGRVLHVTFEVDAHNDSRRWIEVGIGQAGDELVDIAKFEFHNQAPTVSGKYLRWQILNESNALDLFPAINGVFSDVDLMQFSGWDDSQSTARILWDHTGPFANGTPQDLDKRHKFDLYVSKTHYRIMETTPDGLYNVVRDKDFPAGSSLPFDQCQVYFVHQVYHTWNDIHELRDYCPQEQYWYNDRPFADERHWDNIGFEVLNSFPQ